MLPPEELLPGKIQAAAASVFEKAIEVEISDTTTATATLAEIV